MIMCKNPKCGEMFEPKNGKQIYCCDKCRRYVHNLRHRERVKRIPFVKGGTNRPFTTDTVYLIHKWYIEGMSREVIAEILQRDIKQINEALLTPLSTQEKIMIQKYRKVDTK